MAEILRVAALQTPHGKTAGGNLDAAQTLIDDAVAAGARLALLPEYFFATMGGRVDDQGDAAAVRAFFAQASARIALAGNVVEVHEGARRNVGVVYEAGKPTLEQVKLHPMPREIGSGIVGGRGLTVAPVAGRPTGILVCADVLYPEVSQMLALRGAEVLLNPVLSAFRQPDPDKEARKALYIARAYDAGAFVIKAGGYLDGRIAGRSLVAAPWGILAHAPGEFEKGVVVADLDFDALATFREGQKRFSARRPDVYRDLVG